MGGRRAVLAAWLSASGCVVSVGDKSAAPAPVVPDAPAREFASLRPGDFRPDNPALAAEVPPKPADPPPIPTPSFKPPDQFVTALVTPDSPIVAAVRNLEADRPADAELPPGVLPLLASAVQAARAKGPAATGEAVRQLDAAAAALAPQAPLEVTKAAFCKDVRGFGLYEPLPTDRPTYPAGKKPAVWVYLEVRNVVMRPDGGRYLWQPRATWVVRDSTGALVDQKAMVPPREPVRTPTRDNYVGVYFQAPERAGAYSVVVTVTEPAGDGRGVSREVSKQLSFTVK